MMQYAIGFFVLALLAALLGQGGIAGLSAEIGYVLVVASLVFVAVAFLTGRSSGKLLP